MYSAKCSANENMRALKIFFDHGNDVTHIEEFLREFSNIKSVIFHENIIAIHGIAYKYFNNKI